MTSTEGYDVFSIQLRALTFLPLQSTVVQRGQKVVDSIGIGQQSVVVDPILHPTEEVSACFGKYIMQYRTQVL